MEQSLNVQSKQPPKPPKPSPYYQQHVQRGEFVPTQRDYTQIQRQFQLVQNELLNPSNVASQNNESEQTVMCYLPILELISKLNEYQQNFDLIER